MDSCRMGLWGVVRRKGRTAHLRQGRSDGFESPLSPLAPLDIDCKHVKGRFMRAGEIRYDPSLQPDSGTSLLRSMSKKAGGVETEGR